jgi:transcriptional regulator with XRE-family HTH domain
MSRSHRQSESDLSITDAEAARIGDRIRQIRGTARQREFADHLGISREQLSRIESGAQVPGTETLRRLARVARVSVDWVLLGGSGAERQAAVAGGWAAALEPLLAGTKVRLARADTALARRADRAWPRLSEARREEVRAFVGQIAAVALAIEALLPPRAARPVALALGTAATALVVERILAAAGRRALS